MTSSAAVEFVRNLPPDAKEAVFVDLLKEIIRENGTDEGLIPINTAEGVLGVFYPPKALDHLFEMYGPKLTPDDDAEIQRRIDNPGKTWTLEEALKSFEEEDAAEERAAAQRGIG